MKKVLIVGDFHIPTRANRIPPKVQAELESETYDVVLCTGDLISNSILKWLDKVGDEVYVVKGNMDFLKLPEKLSVRIESLKWGLFHGSGIFPRGNIAQLTRVASQMDVDVLVHGHTHVLSINEVKHDDKTILLVNPGSATGVWSGSGGSLIPSFIKAIVSNRDIELICFELISDNLRSRHTFFSL